MIKTNIQSKYIHQYNLLKTFTDNIFVADYTEQTKTELIKRSVEFFSPAYPTDITYFSLVNTPKHSIDGIEFNNSSFVYPNGNPKTQCEAVFFPSISNTLSWVLFCELKYSSLPSKNENNLRKAIKQLYKTRYYYYQNGIVLRSNNCYLVASLPMQSEPFTNFSIPQPMLIKLKRTRGIILRLTNSVEVIDDEQLSVD